jgi:hypothetical protein
VYETHKTNPLEVKNPNPNLTTVLGFYFPFMHPIHTNPTSAAKQLQNEFAVNPLDLGYS